MIGIGLIIVLFVQLVFSFFEQREAEMRNKANFYIDQGRAEIMEWGEDEFVKAYDGGVILEGDTLLTKAESQGVLVLYNGMEVRFDENTQVEIETLENHGDEDELVLEVEKGQIWIDQAVGDKGTVDVVVKTDNINVYAGAGQFAVLNRGDQAVRTVEGSVDVELVEREGKDIVIDEVVVGVGQQIYMSSSDAADLVARRNMDFLEAIDDEWKEGDFYLWNLLYESEIRSEKSEEEIEEEEIEEEEVVVDDDDDDDEEIVYEDPELVLTNPETSPYVLEGDQIYITGEVSGYAEKIVVTSYTEEGESSDYQLSLFEAGDTEWSYNAAISYENLHEGENEFVVTAYSSDGYEADSLIVVVNVLEIEIEELACGEITLPVVLTIDGEEWTGETHVTSKDTIRIEGSVECAYAIQVNGYQLTLFEPESTQWAYVPAVEYGNLLEGENTYEVIALDAEGNVSEAAVFTVKYEPVEEEVVVDDEEAESGTGEVE